MNVKVGEYFPNELGPDGRPSVPDDAFLVVSHDKLEAWCEAEDDRPLACRVVMPGCAEWEELAGEVKPMDDEEEA